MTPSSHKEEDPNSWMIESMAQFMECPEWLTPVQQFIDQHCTTFDTVGTEESRIEFKLIHDSFKLMCETLLERFLEELGIPLDAFVTVAAKVSATNGSLHGHMATQMLEYLVAVGDYQLFRCMMEKRNLALELEVMDELQKVHGAHATTSTQGSPSHIELPPGIDSSWLTLAESMDDNELLNLAIQASLEDYDAKQRELDDAEFLEALKLSQEVYRLTEHAEPSTQDTNAEATSAPTPPPEVLPSPITGAKPTIPSEATTPKVLEEQAKVNVTALSHHRKLGFGSLSKPLPAIPKNKSHAPVTTDGTVPEAKHELLPTQASSTASSTTASITEEDVAKRAQYMKAQKERIIQMKNKNRQNELDRYVETRSSGAHVPIVPISIDSNGETTFDLRVQQPATPEEVDALRARLALAQRFREDLVQVTRQARDTA